MVARSRVSNVNPNFAGSGERHLPRTAGPFGVGNPEAGRSNRPPLLPKNAGISGVFYLQVHLALTPAQTAGRLWRG
jgi:hypothetical protein